MTGLDYAILVAALIALLAIGGRRFTRRQDGHEGVLPRQPPRGPWVGGVSFVPGHRGGGALTIIGVPATAYPRELGSTFQFVIGSSAGQGRDRPPVSCPAFFKHEVTSIYELLGIRFGRVTQVDVPRSSSS